MSPAARQLCAASNTVAANDQTREKCPRCARPIVVTRYIRHHAQGQTELRPIIPAHPADTAGEIRMKVSVDRHRYPGSGEG